ncbi:hypothetical protein DXG01_006109, partial [Tephrocybe rancida]
MDISPPTFPPQGDLLQFPFTPPSLDQGVSPVVRAPNLWVASPLTPLTDSEPPRIKRKLRHGQIAKVQENARATAPAPSEKTRRTLRSSRLAVYATAPPSSLSLSTSTSPSSSSETPAETDADPAPIYTTRSFPPATLTPSPSFPLLYRRFPLSSYYATSPTADPLTLFNPSHPGGAYNPPRSALDLYTPRFVKGKGTAKQGLCPICAESRARGGASRRVWLSMKFSAFKCYHLQYAHGISASTGRPFAPPLSFRTTPRPHAARHERTAIQEARCHKCTRWVPVEGVKDVEAK